MNHITAATMCTHEFNGLRLIGFTAKYFTGRSAMKRCFRETIATVLVVPNTAFQGVQRLILCRGQFLGSDGFFFAAQGPGQQLLQEMAHRWALFGKLADSETDWHQLVAELGSSNENRRWRAALGLAQVLRNQQLAPDTDEVLLARQPEVAVALSELLKESMESRSTNDKEVKNQEFLARTLGTLEADDIVLPMLAKALESDKNIEVRKSSLMSLAMIAGRKFEVQVQPDARPDTADEIPTLDTPLAAPTINEESVKQQLRLAAQDPEPAIRHLATFVLGLVSGPEAVEQLEVLLLDGDSMTRANAAVALARNGQVQGVPVLLAMLTDGMTDPGRDDFAKLAPEEQQLLLQHRQFEQPIILRNCIRAIQTLWPKIDEARQAELKAILSQISQEHSAADIRIQAHTLLNQI